jgi:glutamate N-acetyltransferase/amino-acid N-acetyltransferase
MTGKRSPLAPAHFPEIKPVAGVTFSTAETGIRYQGREDLLLVEFDQPAAIAGVLTKSLTRSAPVDWCRKGLKGGKARGIVVNAGNANAFTGKAGEALVKETAKATAKKLNCKIGEVFIASTGVIGQPLPATAIAAALPKLAETGWLGAAKAIMTTDTFPKAASAETFIGGKKVTVAGIAKGSGMIAPDMATLLAFVFTDAAIAPAALQKLLSDTNEKSFNASTVDGDTSTSDTLLVAATGAAGNTPIKTARGRDADAFKAALQSVLSDLAKQVVRDGEGATKFITVKVAGAMSDKAAKRIALSIANSPLVKTAIAGEDANWGRIVMAIGKAGEKADRDRLKVSIGGVTIAKKGMQVPHYDEAPVAAHMRGQEIDILVDIGLGHGAATIWTCDLTHGYIDINGSYRS